MSLGCSHPKCYNQKINPYTPWTQRPVVVVHFNRSMVSLLAMPVAALTISGRFAHLTPWGDVSCVYHGLSYGYGELWSNDVLKPKFWTCSKQRVFHPGFDARFDEVSADSIGESYPVLSHPLLCGFNDFDCFMLKRSFLFHNYDPGLNALKSLWMYSDIHRDRDVFFQMILMIGFNGKTQVWCGWKQMWMNNHKHITYIRCIYMYMYVHIYIYTYIYIYICTLMYTFMDFYVYSIHSI